MPLAAVLCLALPECSKLPGSVNLLIQLGVDGADFWVGDAVSFALRVEDGMNVEAGGRGFSRCETDALDQFFL